MEDFNIEVFGDSMYINSERCKEVVKILDKFFANRGEIAHIEFPTNINFKTNEYYLYMFYLMFLLQKELLHNFYY